MSAQPASFPLFLVLWNTVQNQPTPDVHVRIANWLEAMWETGQTRLLLMAFRACGKSTLVGLFCAWLFYRRPDIRIMAVAADLQLARKLVRNVKRIIERHPLTPHLRPRTPDEWASDRFTIARDSESRDPSMLAKGVTSNLTGTRADLIICDDVEVPNTSDTAEKRAELRARLAELDFILTPEGTQLYVGTPHSYYTLYAKKPRVEIGEETPFLSGFKRLEVPLVDAKGQSAWPERYPAGLIAEMRTRTGPAHFASQMQLQPVNIAQCRLDPANLQCYESEIVYTEAGRQPQIQLQGKTMRHSFAWWDPAFAAHGGDRSVLAVLFADGQGQYWLHDLIYIPQHAKNEDSDEATRQCRIVAQALQTYHLTAVALEINGLGRFLPGILRRELAALNVRAAVREIASRKAKDLRILEAFDAVLAARALHVHQRVLQTPFPHEMAEWRAGGNGHDDGLDAVAGALSLAPVRVERGAP